MRSRLLHLRESFWFLPALFGVLAVGLAVLMHRLTKSVLIRGSLLLPYLIANVVVALLWFWMLDYNIGIVNAVIDAVRHFGIDDIVMPCTPERVWKAIQSAGRTQDAPPVTEQQAHFVDGALNQDDPANDTQTAHDTNETEGGAQ